MRAYRLLLRLFPRSFRNEYGREMEAIVARRRRDARGPLRAGVFWLGTIAETVADAARVQLDQGRLDLRDAVRSLSRDPGFAVTAVLVTALGVGATTAVVSVADHVLVRPLPFPEPDRLVKVWQDQSRRGYSRMELSPGNYRDWHAGARSAFSGLAAFTGTAMNLASADQPERLEGARVTADFFRTLGVPATIGRTFVPGDADGPPPVVVGMPLWRRVFESDPNVLGRTVVLDGSPHVIVGVMPDGFHVPDRAAEFWTLLAFEPGDYEDRANVFLRSIGRLAPGVSIEQARQQLNAVAARLAREYPEPNAETGATVVWLRDEVTAQSRQAVLALVAAAAALLLIACANLMHLLLARTLRRRREFSLRAALGAGAERLVRQQLTESVVLALAGSALGVAIAVASVPLVARLVPTSLPVGEVPAPDLRLLALAAAVTARTAIGFGLVPALRAATARSLDALREGPRTGDGRGTDRLRSGLVVAEVAASVVLLVTAGLLLTALWRVQHIDPGFRSDGVLTMRTALPMPAYLSAASKQQFYDRVLDGVRQLPGVRQAAYTSFLPMVMRGGIWPVVPEGQPEEPGREPSVSLRLVTPGYFDALGIPLLQGRNFDRRDARDPAITPSQTARLPVTAVVSASFARQFLPGMRPVGLRFRMRFMDATIVGVVGDVRVRGLERESEPQVYLPTAAIPDGALNFYAPKDLVISVASGDPLALAPAVRRIVRAVDAAQPVSGVRTLASVVEAETGERRTQLRVLVLFAGVAVLLAAVGIHGLLAYVVSSRTRELGVRIALGATPRAIVQLVLGRGLALATAGVAIGSACAYVAGRAVQALLAGVSPADPASFATAALVALAVSVAGSAWPTLRAIRIDPAEATRAD